MLKLKKLLLDTGLVIDNQYLDEYVELIINNFDSIKVKNTTQEHHSIPVFCYSLDETGKYQMTDLDSAERRRAATKLANADKNNKRVHLTYADHIKAHLLLSRCGKSYRFILSNANACVLMLNLLHTALENKVVPDLDSDVHIQAAYEHWCVTKTKPTDRSDFYKAATANLRLGTCATRRKVKCLETGLIYDSIREAEIDNSLSKNRLNLILTGRRKQIPGMTFEYYNETSGISEVIE